jgi:hypothetical protein
MDLPQGRQLVAHLSLGAQQWKVGQDRAKLQIGRAQWNDLVVEDSFVSRDHGQVAYRNGKIYLDDRSTNGSYIVRQGGRVLFVRRETIRLEGQGRIRLGRWEGREIAFTVKELSPDGTWLTQCAPQSPDAFDTPPGNVFKQEGEYWTIAYDGSVLRMKDSKGLHYLACLLRHPDREFHVLDLVAQVGGGDPGTAKTVELDRDALHVDGGAGAGPVLDAAAKVQYKRRLTDLHDGLEEAERFNESERAEQLRAEMEVLTHELASAVGLGGRDREAASNAERARVMVTLRVRTALKKIRANRPALGRYLDATIKTGRFCSYTPDPAQSVSWAF